MGATVVMVCRDEGRGKAARDRVAAESGNNSVEVMTADLSSMASVRSLAASFTASHPRLDVLVNNAATFQSKRSVTPDGYELMFATNYLGAFLLTRLLLPALKAAAPSRVINVSAPSSMSPDLDDPHGERVFRPIWAFGASKAALLLFTFELARRLEGTGVTVNAYHPGLVRTKLVRSAPSGVRVVSGVLNVFMGVSPKRAARGLAELASSPDFAATTGALVREGKVMRSRLADDTEAQDRLWKASSQFTGLPDSL